MSSISVFKKIFDHHLTWKVHIEDIVARCKRKLNILRSLTGTSFGSSSKSLLMVYRAIIRSLLDYGCEAYDSASPSIKRKLDSIQYQALRICAGGLPLTSLAAVQVELGETPLDLRRKYLTDKFRKKIEMHTDHPLLPNIKPCWQFNLSKLQKNNKPFGVRAENVNLPIEPNKPEGTPPWLFQSPNVSVELTKELNKNEIPAYQYQKSLELINSKWSNQFHIYTDGSKVPNTGICAASFYAPAFHYYQSKRLNDNTSCFRAELAAIILALYWIQSINVYVGTVIFSDSLSSLVAITEQKEISFVTEILTLTTNLKYQGKDVYFEWIPSHCGINGNEMADMYAKKALEKNMEINNKLSLSEIKHVILKKYIMEWQNRWNGAYHYLK